MTRTLAVTRLALLTRAVPELSRVAMLANPDNPCDEMALGRLRAATWRQLVEASRYEARSAEEIERGFAAMREHGADGLLVQPDTLFSIHARRLVALAAEHRLPAVYGVRSFCNAGGLMALHGDTAEVIRWTVTIVTRILGGASPATLPVESLTRLELTVNAGTARTLGLTLPPSLLARANAVIPA